METPEELTALLMRAALDICALQDQVARLQMADPEALAVLRDDNHRLLMENRAMRVAVIAAYSTNLASRRRVEAALTTRRDDFIQRLQKIVSEGEPPCCPN